MFKVNHTIPRFATCVRHDDDIPVESDLALTPAQMEIMTNNGTPVSTQLIAGNFEDGVPNPSDDMPLVYQRGADIVDAWVASKDAEQKIGHAKSKFKQYSNFEPTAAPATPQPSVNQPNKS